MLGQAYDREVQVYVSNGGVAHFTIREMFMLYTTWHMWALFAVGFLILSTGHPITLPQFDSFWVRLGFWWLALGLYLFLSPFYAVLTHRLWSSAFRGPIPLLLLSTPLLLVATYGAAAVLTFFFEPGRPLFDVMSWQMNLRNIFVAHLFETLALIWLLPALRARAAQTHDTRTVTLAGQRVLLRKIQRIKAAEHYLELHMDDGVEILRERMATFLDQVSDKDGIQTHRSHWVSSAAAGAIKGTTLRLRDGSTVPVARGRTKDVRGWIEARLAAE